MKPAPCPRLFEAEAMRDGRLRRRGAGELRAAHGRVRARAGARSQALDGLAEALRASAADERAAPTSCTRCASEPG